MAAYTCTGGAGSYAWTNTASWTSSDGAGNYPFKLRATDTFTIASGYAFTIGADNAFAGTGAGVINSGGSLINNFVQLQSFCGALTNNGVCTNNNGKKMWVTDGTFTGGSGSTTTLQPTGTLHFTLTTAGTNGLSISAGGSAILDGTIEGAAGKETWVSVGAPLFTGGQHATILGGTLLTINYAKQTYAALTLSNWNIAYVKGAQLGNITITNVVCAYGLYSYLCVLEDDTGTITMTNCGATSYAFLQTNGIVKGGTWNITHTSSCFSPNSPASIVGGTFNLISSGGAACISLYATLYIGGTAVVNTTTTNASYYAISSATTIPASLIIDGSAVVTATASGAGVYGIYAHILILNGGTLNINAPTTGLYVLQQCVLDGTVVTISGCTSTAAGTGALVLGATTESPLIIRSGSLTIDVTNTGNGIAMYQARGQSIKSTAACPIVNLAGVPVLATNYMNVEPWEFITAGKTMEAYWSCFPSNQSDFGGSESISIYYNTAGATVVHNGKYWITSKYQPWQVTGWGTFTVTASGGAVTWVYEVSYDGGTTWGSTVAINSGDTVAAVPKGNGQDAIRFTATNASGSTAVISTLTLTLNTYDSSTFVLPTAMLSDGQPLRLVSGSNIYETM